MPRLSWLPCNRMGEIEGRLVVGVYDGKLYVLIYKRDKWETFVRKHCHIRNVCHQGVCLVCVDDEDRHQLVIEQFYLNKDDKWRFLTVLPNELQLLVYLLLFMTTHVLYVVGGRTESMETVNTVRVCDLHSGHWSKMDDMQTKRLSCFSVVIDNTVFVGGGLTGGFCSSNIVESAGVGVRKWRTISCTTT